MDSCHETRHARDDVLPTHRHRGAYAALVIEGAYREASLDGPLRCTPGTLVLHPAFHAHGDRFGGGGARVLNVLLPATAVPAFHALRVPDLRWASEVFRRDPDGIVDLLHEAEPGDATVPVPDWQAAFLDALCNGEEPVGAIARRLGVSDAHASRALAASHGMPPRALRREARWRRAVVMLRGNGTLADIAAGAGFADQSHFTRTCRNQAGATPSQLRRQIKCVQDAGRATAV
jgi:AraC family transcriptional regulator